MTWVIGMPGLPTRGVLVGDVRISVRHADGREAEYDGVQKVFGVAPNIAVGFAGNIDTAFKMIGDFAEFMRASVPDGYVTYQPSRAIFKWARRARFGWTNWLSGPERRGSCSLIFIAALQPAGPFTPTVGYVVREPAFTPHPIPPGHARSIGSGSQIAAYTAAIEDLAGDREILQFETFHWDAIGGAGLAVGLAVSDAIDSATVSGISPHLHICSVRYGEVRISTNDREALTPGVGTLPSTSPTGVALTRCERVLIERVRFPPPPFSVRRSSRL
jgi:hypothetical protein